MKPRFNFQLQQHIFDPSNPFNYQTNEEWLALRADRITASLANELFVDGKSKDGLGKTIRKRLNKRVMQRHTGWVDDEAASIDERECIRRGIVFEQEALAWYSQMTGRQVVPCGFVERGKYLGCSPDGIVIGDDKRLVQIKIPMPGNFAEKIVDDGHLEYVPQCETELFVCDYAINDLIIYSPELMTGKIIPVERSETADRRLLSKMRRAVQHQDKVDSEITRLKNQKREPNEVPTMRKSD